MKLKNFCTTKAVVSKLKRPTIEWKEIFASCVSDKRQITRTPKKLMNKSKNGQLN
jgi:hypothetical protein